MHILCFLSGELPILWFLLGSCLFLPFPMKELEVVAFLVGTAAYFLLFDGESCLFLPYAEAVAYICVSPGGFGGSCLFQGGSYLVFPTPGSWLCLPFQWGEFAWPVSAFSIMWF